MFKAQTFYDMMDRLWAAIFDLLLRMSNLFRERSSGEGGGGEGEGVCRERRGGEGCEATLVRGGRMRGG